MFKQLYRLIILLYECQILTNFSVRNELLKKSKPNQQNYLWPRRVLNALCSWGWPWAFVFQPSGPKCWDYSWGALYLLWCWESNTGLCACWVLTPGPQMHRFKICSRLVALHWIRRQDARSEVVWNCLKISGANYWASVSHSATLLSTPRNTCLKMSKVQRFANPVGDSQTLLFLPSYRSPKKYWCSLLISGHKWAD